MNSKDPTMDYEFFIRHLIDNYQSMVDRVSQKMESIERRDWSLIGLDTQSE